MKTYSKKLSGKVFFEAGAILFALFMLLVFFTFYGCSSMERSSSGDEIEMAKTTFSFDQEKAPYELFPKYRISPGDVLDILFQIRTWEEKKKFVLAVDHTIQVKFLYAPNLNQRQKVRPDGKITLPYIGNVYVVGKTVEQLTKELRKKYSKILRDPELYIIIPVFREALKELKKDLHTAPRGLSKLITVRPDGYATFPMVGEIFAAGKTIKEVDDILNKRYESILPDLHCDLFLHRHAGTVIYVLGEVSKPGTYPIRRPTSITEALTMAGGITPDAKLKSVFVIRRHEDKMVATRIDLKKTLSFENGSEFFYLYPDDIVYVPKTWLATAADVAKKIANVLFFRGWSVGFTWELHTEPTRVK